MLNRLFVLLERKRALGELDALFDGFGGGTTSRSVMFRGVCLSTYSAMLIGGA